MRSVKKFIMMKTVILLATLKKEGQSNTEVLSEFLGQQLVKNDIEYEIIRLVNYNIQPGTYNDMAMETNGRWYFKRYYKLTSSYLLRPSGGETIHLKCKK